MPDCSDYKSFMVMDVLDRATELEHQGKHIIHLEIGEPDFGTKGEGHLRFSYANSVESIEEGLNRLQKYIIQQD